MTKKDEKTDGRKVFMWGVIVILLTLEGFLSTWSRVQCTNAGYALSKHQEDRRQLLSMQKKLIIEREHLRSPERITAIASRRMGLKMPDQNQILTIRLD
jgi:cell division protein FtsL